MKKQKATTKRKTEHALVGKFLHSLGSDGQTIEWQGRVESEVTPGFFLVQRLEWIAGRKSNKVVVPIADMAYWPIYDSAEEMKEAYERHPSTRKKQE